jgi:hypothetical protein
MRASVPKTQASDWLTGQCREVLRPNPSKHNTTESWISVLEAHSTKTRGLEQLSMEVEMMVAVNGSECVYSAPVVEEALSLYWSGAKRDSQKQGHFFRTWSRKKEYVVSKVVDGLSAREAKRGFLL